MYFTWGTCLLRGKAKIGSIRILSHVACLPACLPDVNFLREYTIGSTE